MVHFTINGREFASRESHVTVAWLLQQIGLKPGDAVLERSDTGETWSDPSALVELRERDKFEAKPKRDPTPVPEPRISYTVNGEPQVTEKTPLTVEEILRQAGADAAIDLNQLESYYLDNVRTGARYEDLDDEVPIADGDQFVALHAGRTPVA